MSQRIIHDTDKYPDEYWDKYRRSDGSLAAWDVPHEELEYVLGHMYSLALGPGGGGITTDIGFAVNVPQGFVVGKFPDASSS